MKKFKYRAEAYLKFLLFKREQALKDLKVAENYRDNLMKKMSLMEEQMKEAYKKNSEVGQGGRDIRFIHDNNSYMEMLKVHMKNLTEEISYAEQEYQIKHKALLALQMKVKQIEVHKEAEIEKFKKEFQKKAQKLTDEINTTRRRGKNAKSL